MNHEQVGYIRSELERGAQEADIAANLAVHGWSADAIQQAFAKLGYQTDAPISNRRFAWFRRSLNPRHVGIALCATILLGAGISGAALAYRAVTRHRATARHESVIAMVPKSAKPGEQFAATVTSAPCTISPYPLRANTAHPLARYAFPESPIPYPKNYPPGLRLPDNYQPVEVKRRAGGGTAHLDRENPRRASAL